MCFSAIGKLHGSLRICLTYGNGENPNLGLPFLIQTSPKESHLLETFFAKKFTFTDPIGVLFVGTDQVLHELRLYSL